MPQRKVGAGALAGALSVIIVWALGEFAGWTIPPEVASAGTVVLTFLTSYFVPEA
jgi:hypothetical protein